MRFSSLGSGSRGNATLVEARGTCLMIDCGFSLKETERRLARLARQPQQIDALLVTHEHADHIQGVGRLARRFDIPVWMTYGTSLSGPLQSTREDLRLQLFDVNSSFSINGIEVQPFPVPHDANEPCQFVFSDGDSKLALLTDTGSVTPHIVGMLANVDALLLECNHDIDLLWQGSYPQSVKQRIAGDYGHMSNRQAAGLLRQVAGSRLQRVVAMHLSRDNNSHDHVIDELLPVLGAAGSRLEIADQEHGLCWREIEPNRL